nr:immunoglobulin light chain junction region [Macaca mulatta]MOX47876.1 immunoglobulin light chain junction region [Macaca mulatta]MOX48006.1 immunoglobulin light chain junction region [Macaca mulatta]MOX49159.1 immunoglobulin light chain junction region [Macaca mulatta]MOX49219.1 immunoglobulin light chain junction region [Macaca mulatta]
CQTYIRSPFTF